LTFDAANLPAIIGKLKDLNQKSGDGKCKLEENVLESIGKLADPDAQMIEHEITTLNMVLQWPKDSVFPALDILRLAIKTPRVNYHYCCDERGMELVSLLLSKISDDMPANQMLALRVLANMFDQEPGEELALNARETILSVVIDAVPSENKNVQIAVCTVILNFAVALRTIGNKQGKLELLPNLVVVFDRVTEAEAQFRLLVALGTLMHGDADILASAKSLDLHLHAQKLKDRREPVKLGLCLQDLEKMMS